MKTSWKVSAAFVLALMLALGGWRYKQVRDRQQARLEAEATARKNQILRLEEQVRQKQDWTEEVFSLEMERLRKLREDVVAAQKAVDESAARLAESGGQMAGVVPPDARDESQDKVSEFPEASETDVQALKQNIWDLRLGMVTAQGEYESSLTENESRVLQEDLELVRQMAQVEANVHRLTQELEALLGFVDLASLNKLESLRASLVQEQTRLSSFRTQREELQNRLKVENLIAKSDNETRMRSMQMAEADLQNQLETAQMAQETKIETKAAGIVAADSAADSLENERRRIEHQARVRELEEKKRLLAREQQAVDNLLLSAG